MSTMRAGDWVIVNNKRIPIHGQVAICVQSFDKIASRYQVGGNTYWLSPESVIPAKEMMTELFKLREFLK